ncbi:MAG: hypothetical protein IT260_05135, partial [Saprospiraceae bacterium]|nr:hypothetical protein [Saprospiraceae bacterium]
MTTSVPVKLVWALLLFGACLSPARAQVFWSDAFSQQAEAIAKWQHGGTNAGPSKWLWTDIPNAGFQDPILPAFNSPSVSDGYFLFNSNNNGLAPHDNTLTQLTKPADCTGKYDVRLRFFSQYIYFNPLGTSAQVGVSTDGVNFQYHTLFDSLPADYAFNGWVELDLNEADYQPRVWLKFRWIGSFEYHWKIDDVQLYLSCSQNPSALLCDDFESYQTTQALGPQAEHWTTWSGTEGGPEDGLLSTEQASTPIQALKIVSTDSTGGPQDVVLDLGTRVWGHYELRWKMYIPSGKKGYYNIQNKVPILNGDWALHAFFGAANAGQLKLSYTGPVLREFSYPNDQWFEIRQLFDLDNNLLTVFIDDKFVLKRVYTKKLGGIDFYGNDQDHLFYVDDVSLVALPPVDFNVDSCDTAVDISQYFGQPAGIMQTTGLFDNNTATVSASDPEVHCWNETGNNGPDILNTTMWFTFTGDGGHYDIQTVPCNASDYNGSTQGHNGDTQMLIFEGANCANLSPVKCNDDLFALGQPDFRAGVNLQTQSGQTYFMLIDGFESQGIVATGEYCIQITKMSGIECSQGQAGTFSLGNQGYLCQDESLSDILSVNAGSFVLPTVGAQNGVAWCFSQAPIPAGTWPGIIPGIASTPFTFDLTPPALPNNGASLDYGVYYLTPVVLGGGTLINSGALPYVFNVDPAGGCFYTGESVKLTLLPTLSSLSALLTTIPASSPPGNNGAILLAPSGGSAAYLSNPYLYQYAWSNGESSKDISNLSPGNYTVTISDATECVGPYVRTATVGGDMVGTASNGLIRSFSLGPNPAQDAVWFSLSLAKPSEIRIEVLNLLGQ